MITIYNDLDQLRRELQLLVYHTPVDQIGSAVEAMQQDGVPCWRRLACMRIVPRFEWLRDGPLVVTSKSPTIYATESLRTTGRRYDGVRYTFDQL